jgi:hypothetical protein
MRGVLCAEGNAGGSLIHLEHAAMSAPRMTKDELPQSFGTFKPVDHVVLAFADDAKADAATRALRDAGFGADDVIAYSAAEKDSRMRAMLEHASDVAGFGYEISLMRRYQQLARDGASWLIVYAPEEEQGERVGAIAREHGALAAVKYHRLVVEDII